MEIGLSLGSNLGDRAGELSRARHEIASLARTQIVAQSPLYETDPVGVKPEYEHMRFVNGVLVIETELALSDFQRELAAIEFRHGRRRELDRFAPRTIDIDILYAGEVMMETEGLTLPHPRWAERRFVLQPLCDVRPDLVLPGADRRVREILAGLPTGAGVHGFNQDW